VLVQVGQPRDGGRSGWWIYLAASFVPFLNAAAAVAWLSHLHQHPLRLGKADVEL